MTQEETMEEQKNDIKKKDWTGDDWKNSEDIIDRTVYFIAYQSPHNLWKCCQAIRDLLSSLHHQDCREFEKIIGEDEKPQIYVVNNKKRDMLGEIRRIRNVLRSEQRLALEKLRKSI